MAKKFVVYISYGVYVDSVNEMDWDSDEGFALLKREAIAKMWEHGQAEVSSNAEIEFEDVTEEFEETENE